MREWILAAAIFAQPAYGIAQVQSGLRSGVQSGVQSGVRSGFDHRDRANSVSRAPTVYYGSCWRATATRRGIIRVWNCQLTALRDCCGAAPLTSHGTVAAPAGELAW